MLDSETRRRIDSARDILVGKVPDPKSQVEQITIALVYKFMDDMDKQSVEMGGKASFFKGKFAKYGWSNIFDPRLGGVEMLNLYGEAITNMSQNENLPQLFRDIFKNAFLPYRDPETLKLFLKTINEFTYDHSEKLGDAFEYLLSVLQSQGDAGMFRTPRHIIDFMVRVVNPKKNETILDPACGTAGFLISAYKHILESNKTDPKGFKKPLGSLTAQDKKKIYENFTGYDISPDMVRLSLVNLYLHGFVTPQIHEYDALTSEDRWNEYYNVILANPPFMSPKGGIQPHKRFKVQSNRSEVLFVDYMAEHLTANGRAAIIVPEGIIFQSARAYKQLRKYLVEDNYLWAVVSLPAGVFNPYASVKTSILFLDKALAKKTDEILFVKVEADGFDLGAQRRPIDRNELPDALNTLKQYQQFVNQTSTHQTLRDSFPSDSLTVEESLRVLLVSKSRLAENENYNLSADRYREVTRAGKQTYPMVKLEDVCEINPETAIPSEIFGKTEFIYIDISSIENGSGKINYSNKLSTEDAPSRARRLIKENDVLLSTVRPNLRAFAFIKNLPEKSIASTGFAVLRAKENILSEYLYAIIFDDRTVSQMIQQMGKGAYPSINQTDVESIQIPLPPLETQRQLVDEIAAHQRIIDGARQVVEGWKPDIESELIEALKSSELEDWEWSTIENACLFNPKKNEIEDLDEKTLVSFVPMEDLNEHMMLFEPKKERTKGDVYKGYTYFRDNDVILAKVTPCFENGKSGIARNLKNGIGFGSSEYYIFRSNGKTLPEYIYYLISQQRFIEEGKNRMTGTGGLQRVSKDFIANYQIPLPPLEVQHQIVARIERERSIIEGNRELIRIYEDKVKKVIERVWEG